jgi:hypothetical protein
MAVPSLRSSLGNFDVGQRKHFTPSNAALLDGTAAAFLHSLLDINAFASCQPLTRPLPLAALATTWAPPAACRMTPWHMASPGLQTCPPRSSRR